MHLRADARAQFAHRTAIPGVLQANRYLTRFGVAMSPMSGTPLAEALVAPLQGSSTIRFVPIEPCPRNLERTRLLFVLNTMPGRPTFLRCP